MYYYVKLTKYLAIFFMNILKHTLHVFLQELKKFAIKEWWIFLMFFISLFIVGYTASGNILEISLVFTFHFLADLFVIMMYFEYSQKNLITGSWYQAIACIIFTLIGIYSGLSTQDWQYLIPQAAFILVAIKNIYKDAYKKDLSYINGKTAVMGNILVIIVCILLQVTDEYPVWIQIFGFAGFSSALAMDEGKRRYLFSLISVFLVTFGSGLVLLNLFLLKEVTGVSISYTLLPLTVFLSFLSLWKRYFPKTLKKI